MGFWCCYMWYQSEASNTRLEAASTRIQNRKTKILTMLKKIYVHKYNYFLQEMEGVEAFVEDGSHHNNPDNLYA